MNAISIDWHCPCSEQLVSVGDSANHKAEEAEALSKSEAGPAREQERQLSKKVIFSKKSL